MERSSFYITVDYLWNRILENYKITLVLLSLEYTFIFAVLE